METIYTRICNIRKIVGYTQEQFGIIGNMTRVAYAKMESGKSAISADFIQAIVKHFNITYDYLFDGSTELIDWDSLAQTRNGKALQNYETLYWGSIGKIQDENFGFKQDGSERKNERNLRDLPENSSKNTTFPGIQEHIFNDSGQKIKVLVISTNKNNEENIVFIPDKAVAGYAKNYSNALYIKDLPTFNLPFLKQGTYRAVEIDGDSMEPRISEGDICIGRYISNPQQVDIGSICLVVTDNQGILCKRVEKAGNKVYLHSINPTYSKYPINTDEINELYLVVGFLRLWKKHSI